MTSEAGLRTGAAANENLTRMQRDPGTERPNAALDAAFRRCWQIATSHYENFSVGSRLLPRSLRRHVAAIYAFARTADDIADEGTRPAAERLAQLDAWGQALEQCFAGHATHPIFVALAHTAAEFALPIDPFRKLLQAFRSDVEFRPFETFEELRRYCQCSADPVGYLILYLFGYRDAPRQHLADQICTGLQLANFWQDLAVDAANGRLYVPREDLERFRCSAVEVTRGIPTSAFRRLMAFEVQRARAMLEAGLQLAADVDRRTAREVLLFAWGGLAILRKIEAADYDVFARRPVLSGGEKMVLVARALMHRPGSFNRLPKRGSEPSSFPRMRESIPPPHLDTRFRGYDGVECETAPTATTSRAKPVEATRGNPLWSRLARGTARRRVSPPGDLRAAYAYCRQVTRRSSSNFAYAFRLLAPERRDALYAVYAFCRFIDDVVDAGAAREPAALLARWHDELQRVYDGTPTHPIGQALADAVHRFHLPQRHFSDLIRGVHMDLTQRRYASFDELYDYCYLVASTVGLLCVEIFGYERPTARDYAVDLGVAFKLTNILRDVMEDGRRGRIYLPLDDLRRFGCAEDDLLKGRYSPSLGALMAFECGRARAYYLRARGALCSEDRGSLAAAEAMRLIYERLLDRIEARHFNVFGARVTLPRYQKITLALAAWGRSQLAAFSS